MRIVSYNIQFGRGRDGRFDLPRIAAEVAGADLIALQEVERYWRRSGDVDQVAELAALLPDYHWVYGPGVDVHASLTDDQGRPLHRRRQFGNLLLSRKPILATRNHFLPKRATLEPMSIQRTALEAVIDTLAGPLRFYSIHLTHLAPETRLPQIERLLDLHSRAASEGMPMTGARMPEDWAEESLPLLMPREAVMLGDFNMQPESVEYRTIAGSISDYGGRMSSPEGLVDAWTWLGKDVATGCTADLHGKPVRFDYCFLSAALAPRLRSIQVDEAACGSDHQPLWLEIDL